MLKKDINKKELSNSFKSAIASPAQRVKPRVIIDLLDSRHIDIDGVIENSDNHTSNSIGSLGYFFSNDQLINGYERESFTWAVTDVKDKYGKIITANGEWHCMPTSLEDDYEFGWWSKTRSNSSGIFTVQPQITIPFTERKVNKIKVITSEFLGQIKSCRVRVQNASATDLFDKTIEFGDDEYIKEYELNSSAAVSANFNATKIIVDVISTKNPNDYARIHEIVPLYQVDITDYVIDYSISRTRDVHESSLPIGGTQNPKLTLKMDNTDKDWSVLDSSSLYGQYMKKDLKINIATGWRIVKTNDILVNTTLLSSLSNSATSATISDVSNMPDGGVNDYFTVTIEPNSPNKEILLCNTTSGTNTLNIVQRGYLDSGAKSHNTGAVVQFDPYEYIPNGDFYIDDWSLGSDMSVSISASDWSKFLTEKKLENGFLLERKTVGQAVQNLAMRRNFPKAQFKQVYPFSSGAAVYGAIARYSFSESAIDDNGSITSLNPGLRLRLWGMRSGKEHEYKQLKAYLNEKSISVEDKILGVQNFTQPDYIDSPSNDALNLINYYFEGIRDSVTYHEYFNGVADGYFFPDITTNYHFKLNCANGTARVYLDDLLICNITKSSASESSNSSDIVIDPIPLIGGNPYKLRVEFFHGAGIDNFSIDLHYQYAGSGGFVLIPVNLVRQVVARDAACSRNLTSNVPGTYTINAITENHHQNDGFLHSNVQLSYTTNILSDDKNQGVLLIDDAYIRIPNNTSIAIGEEDFTIEMVAKFHNGAFSNSGEYVSSWSNSSPTSGFEFYYDNVSSHGFKIKTTSGIETVSSNTDLLQSEFYHMAVTYDKSAKLLSYYINGILEDSAILSGNIATQLYDTTIGGRGSHFVEGGPTYEVGPTEPREFVIDEYILYKNCMTSDTVLDRYISSQVQYIAVFPYLYSEANTIRSAIDDITLADFGRFYIDEEFYGRYEHYNRFFEPSIDQHANIQYSFSDTTNIINGDLQVQLQTNKVIVKVSSVSTADTEVSTLWTASDPTTLAAVNLTQTLLSTDTEMFVSTTTDPVFSNTGYLALSNSSENKTEIIKYNGKSSQGFLNLTRGQFGTPVIGEFAANTKVREARYFEIAYDKKPAVNIKFPFITAIENEDPDMINVVKFDYTPFTAKLVIAASNSVPVDTFVYAQGEDKTTGLPYYSTIAGTAVVVTTGTEKINDQVESIETSIKRYGLKELTIESPYIVDIEHAQKMAQFIISKMSEPVPIININTLTVPTIQLGDRIRITSFDQMGITNQDYWVISQDFNYGESLSQNLVLRKVV